MRYIHFNDFSPSEPDYPCKVYLEVRPLVDAEIIVQFRHSIERFLLSSHVDRWVCLQFNLAPEQIFVREAGPFGPNMFVTDLNQANTQNLISFLKKFRLASPSS